MVTFDNGQIKKDIARVKELSNAAICVLGLTLCIEIAVAIKMVRLGEMIKEIIS